MQDAGLQLGSYLLLKIVHKGSFQRRQQSALIVIIIIVINDMIHNIIEMISKMTNSNDDGAHVDKSLVGEAVLWVHLHPANDSRHRLVEKESYVLRNHS